MKSAIPGYYTVSEAAAFLGKTRSAVYVYIAKGTLKAVRIGQQFMLYQDAVDKYRPAPRGNPNFLKRKRKRR
jgi:excisionase family DNA binding protein